MSNDAKAGGERTVYTKQHPMRCVPHRHEGDNDYCVYRVLDKEVPPAGDGGIGLQQTVCILCEEDEACERDSFWMETLSGKYELAPKDPPGSDFCRSCPSGGHTFRRHR